MAPTCWKTTTFCGLRPKYLWDWKKVLVGATVLAEQPQQQLSTAAKPKGRGGGFDSPEIDNEQGEIFSSIHQN
jgi:hypothetical protein